MASNVIINDENIFQSLKALIENPEKFVAATMEIGQIAPLEIKLIGDLKEIIIMSYSKDIKPIITIAAISDIHSNVFALEAVLKDIKQRNANQIVNLGDILYGPIAPKATYELLMEYQKDIITIRGNQDRQIYEATTADIDSNPTL